MIAALGGSIHHRRSIPKPSKAKPGQVMLTLPALVAAKRALYEAMGETGVELGRRLGISEGAVRRSSLNSVGGPCSSYDEADGGAVQ